MTSTPRLVSPDTGASIGGVITGGTTGSVLFVNPTAVLAQDNTKFFWDDTNFALGLGTTANAITGVNLGTLVVNTPSIASTTEVIAKFGVSDDTSGAITIENGSSTDALFAPLIKSVQSTTLQAMIFVGQGTTDSGGQPIFEYRARIGASTAVATRPLFQITNNGTVLASWDSRGSLSLSPLVRTNGSGGGFTFNVAADTGQAASTESSVWNFVTATRTWATTGTVTLQRDIRISALTYASASASQTFSDAATFAVSGGPIAGSNAIITKAWAILVGTPAATTTTQATGNAIGLFGAGTVNFIMKNTANSVEGLVALDTAAMNVGTPGASSLTLFTTNATRMSMSNLGNVAWSGTAASSGSATMAAWTAPANTNQTLSTEAIDINFNLNRSVQFATGTLALQRAFVIQAPTYAFVGASTLTLAATAAITGAPVRNTNATITTGVGLLIQTNAVAATAYTNAYGLYVQSPTGATNNLAAVFEATAIASAVETIARFQVSDDATGKLEILNGSAADATFSPYIKATSGGTLTGLFIDGATTTDSGTAPAIRLSSTSTLATRPILTIANGGTVVASVTGTTGGTALLLAENTSIGLDPAGSADGKYTGITVTATAGYTQAFGDLVYIDPTDSRWEATAASAGAGADGDCRGILGMVVVAGTDGTACTVLLQGIIRADAKFPTFTVNNPLYASATTGLVTGTKPTTTDYVVRTVGFGITTDEMYFNPSPDFITAA